MKILLILCGITLFIAIGRLPIEFYTFLRIFVTISAIAVVVYEIKNGFSVWIIIFLVIAMIFNPIFPVYLKSKELWSIIDAIAGSLFIGKAIYDSKRSSN